MKFATKPFDIIHLTFEVLLHYLGKLKIKFPAHVEENAENCTFNRL